MTPMRIRPIAEADLTDVIVRAAKGAVAHPDFDRRVNLGADYTLGDAVIELKALDNEGLAAPERQAKLAALFRPRQAGRPVVVIDPDSLPDIDRRRYRDIMRGPLKSAVKHANRQLQQSRIEHPQTSCSVLLVVNNGYASLSHDELLELAEARVRGDTTHIDALVVAGCYLHGDGFDAYALWPMTLVPIHERSAFTGFDALKAAWDELAERFMYDMVRSGDGDKSPVADIVFDLDGVTYVKPAPYLGPSEFYVHGRPRARVEAFHSVAVTFPDLSVEEFRRLRATALAGEPEFADWGVWQALREKAEGSGGSLRPFVAIPVTRGGFEAWRRKTGKGADLQALLAHANDRFDYAARRLLEQAKDADDAQAVRATPPPRRYMMVLTETIGQDEANDLSHIAMIERRGDEETVTPIVKNVRMPHRQALAVGAAHAVRCGLDHLFWRHDRRYGWT